MVNFSVRQWHTLIVLYAANIFVFVSIGLLPPFLPVLATEKGASPSQFGFVFGIFRLTMGLISVLYGRYMEAIGPRLLLCSGILTTTGCCFLMGSLKYLQDANVFICLASTIQVVAALGTAAMTMVNMIYINKEFPDNSGTIYATIETSAGVGNLIGPLLGAILIEAGGYPLPFTVVGCILIIVSIMAWSLLPETRNNVVDDSSIIKLPSSNVTVSELFRLPSFNLFLYLTFGTCFAYGFFLGTLEYHLRPLELSPMMSSLVFVLNSGIYCISCTVWGRLCDTCLKPVTAGLYGTLILTIGFLLLGPAPLIPLDENIYLIVTGTVLFSTGNGAKVVATFIGTTQEAIANGAPDNVATYGIVGGVWNTCFCLSFFLGFSVGGVLLDSFGYDWASMSVIGIEIIGMIATVIHIFRSNRSRIDFIEI